MGELLAHMVIRTESTVNGWVDALSHHLPSNVWAALAVIIGGSFAILLVSAYTINPIITWLVNKPIQWCMAGKPMLSTKCESRETYLVD